MLNRKTVIIACTLVFCLVSIGLGFIALGSKNSEENIVLNNSKQLQNSEENIKAEAKEKSEVKEKPPRPSLQTASRSGGLTPKSSQKSQAQPKPATKPALQVQPISKPAVENTINGWKEADIYWLAKIIHAESRGEPYDGQVAVGAVILRRVKHPDFPKTVKDVIFDKYEGIYQFSPVADGSIWLEPNATAYQAARDAARGIDPSGGALYFYNPVKSTSRWIFSRPITTKIGEHVFAL